MAELHPETRAIRAGRADNETALAPILWATTTFVTPTVEEGRRMATVTGANRFYSRYGNPTVRGLEELGAIKGPMTVVDSTFATPLVQRPLLYGVDLVLHSATKAIAGHNDATLGVVAGSSELLQWLWGFAVLQGANASPFDAMNGL